LLPVDQQISQSCNWQVQPAFGLSHLQQIKQPKVKEWISDSYLIVLVFDLYSNLEIMVCFFESLVVTN
jgi:hypothetical protein